MLTDHQIANVLATAADYIDDHGWLRFSCAPSSRPNARSGPGPVSALGAIQHVITDSPSRSDTPRRELPTDGIDQVMACLDRRYVRLYPNGWFAQHGEPFLTWHSETDYPSYRPCRTQSEIVAFLRAAAGELRGDAIDGELPGWACPVCKEPVTEFPPEEIPAGCPRQGNGDLGDGPPCAVVEDFGEAPAGRASRDGAQGGER
jgi:hypothetical protein